MFETSIDSNIFSVPVEHLDVIDGEAQVVRLSGALEGESIGTHLGVDDEGLVVDIVVAGPDVLDHSVVPEHLSLAAVEGGAFSAGPVESQNMFIQLRSVEATFVESEEGTENEYQKDYFMH